MAISITEQEVRAFVGSNADFYLESWRPALSGEGGATGGNVAAFFLVGLWVSYRKMYSVVFIIFGIVLAETVLEEVLCVAVLKMQAPPSWMDFLIALLAGGVSGGFGNGWYLSHTRRAIADVRSRGLSEEDHLQELAARGRTSLGAALGLFLLFILVMFAVGFVFEWMFGGV